MFTIFHVIRLLAMIAGTAIIAYCGWQRRGSAGLIVAAVVGFVVGAMIGQLPFVAAAIFFRHKLIPMTAEELREYLHADDCPTPNLVLLELNHRGEDISIELPFLYSRLTSDNSNQRAGALAALSSVFPELIERIPDYRPYALTEDCRKHAEPLKVAIDAAATKTSVADTAEAETDE